MSLVSFAVTAGGRCYGFDGKRRALRDRVLPGFGTIAVGSSLALTGPRTHGSRHSRAGDAVGVQVIALVRKFSSLARGSDSILCPTQENGDLSYVERPRAVLEHL